MRRLAWLKEPGGAGFVALVTCVACLAAGGSYARDRWDGERTFSIVYDEEPLWLDVQAWAKKHTDVRDAFIAPPDEDEGFRVEAERSVYAETRDGSLMNFNPAFGREWIRRMNMLGSAGPSEGDSKFCELEVEQLRKIASEIRIAGHRVFLVWPCDDRELPLSESYNNDDYVVYQVDE